MIFTLLTGKIEKATNHSAAFDLFYNGERSIFIGDKVVPVPTGVRTAFDPSLVAIIKEKSGLALSGVELKAGVIDADYREEWLVLARKPRDLHYQSGYSSECDPDFLWKPHELRPGQKIAQFILVSLPQVELVESSGAVISIKTKQREGGFGSTGAA